MIDEGYVMNVQCDDHPRGGGPARAQYIGINSQDCWGQARQHGWRLYEDGRAVCPRCNLEAKSETPNVLSG